jgi:hypothetical protein
METAIKPKKRLEEGEERRFAPHCILATKESDPRQLTFKISDSRPRLGAKSAIHRIPAWTSKLPLSDHYRRVRGLRMGDDNLRQHLEGAEKLLSRSNE